MKTIKKAQTGVKQKPAPAKPKGPRRTTSGMWVDEDKFRPPFDVEYADEKPKAKVKPKKAKSGGSFPDLNKDGKVTKADILKGRGVIAKKGASVKKAQTGIAVLLKGKKTAKPNPAKKAMKAGGKMTKCKYGCK